MNGMITLKFRLIEEQTAELIVADNGIGISSAPIKSDSTGFGGQLVSSIVEEQMDGTLAVESAAGTSCTIRFPFTAGPRETL